MSSTIAITCYVNDDKDLIAYASGKRLRKASAEERRKAGFVSQIEGAFVATVAARTVKLRDPANQALKHSAATEWNRSW